MHSPSQHHQTESVSTVPRPVGGNEADADCFANLTLDHALVILHHPRIKEDARRIADALGLIQAGKKGSVFVKSRFSKAFQQLGKVQRYQRDEDYI